MVQKRDSVQSSESPAASSLWDHLLASVMEDIFDEPGRKPVSLQVSVEQYVCIHDPLCDPYLPSRYHCV